MFDFAIETNKASIIRIRNIAKVIVRTTVRRKTGQMDCLVVQVQLEVK